MTFEPGAVLTLDDIENIKNSQKTRGIYTPVIQDLNDADASVLYVNVSALDGFGGKEASAIKQGLNTQLTNPKNASKNWADMSVLVAEDEDGDEVVLLVHDARLAAAKAAQSE